MPRRAIAYLFVTALVICPFLSSQQSTKPLTNADVISLIKSGLPEGTILTVVVNSPAAFDVSPAALVDLHKQGVSPTVIDAMIAAMARGTQAVSGLTGPNAGSFAGRTGMMEVQYQGPSDRVNLETLNVSGSKTKGIGRMFLTQGISGLQMVDTFRGAQSPVQIEEARPAFHLKGFHDSGRDWLIVRLDKKRDHRELQRTSGATAFTTKAAFREKDVFELEVNRLSEDVLEIRPKQELKPGEYALIYGYSGLLYDFGIKLPKQ